MKKILSIILAITMLVSVVMLVSCSNENSDNNSTNPTTSITTPDDSIFYKNENIAIKDWSKPVFDFYQFEVTDEDLQLYVNYYILLPNAKTTEVREGTVKNEDYIHIFVDTRDKKGNIIKDYTTNESGYFLYIGLGDFIPALDQNLIGKKVGDTVSFETNLKLNGVKTPVDVKATIDYIQSMELPEATDELAVKEGYASLNDFKETYKAQLEQEYFKDAYKVFIESVKRKVVVEVYNYPENLVQSYMQKYEESLAYLAKTYNLTVEKYLEQFSRITYEDWKTQMTEQAKKDVETELLLNAILEACSLTLDEEAYTHYLNQMAEQGGYPSGQVLELAMKQQGVLDDLKRELTMNYGYDVLLLTAKLRLIDWATGEVIVDYVESETTAN